MTALSCMSYKSCRIAHHYTVFLYIVQDCAAHSNQGIFADLYIFSNSTVRSQITCLADGHTSGNAYASCYASIISYDIIMADYRVRKNHCMIPYLYVGGYRYILEYNDPLPKT